MNRRLFLTTPIYIDIPTECITSSFLRRRRSQKLLFTFNSLFGHSQVKWGNWDRRLIPFSDHPTYRLLAAFHSTDYEPERCMEPLRNYYQEQGQTASAAREKAAITLLNYVAEYRVLAENLSRHGYRAGVSKDEIGVAVGRDGAFIKVPNGNHRLALVKLLGIEKVVAEVRFVHREWFRQNDSKRGTSVRETIVEGLRRAGFSPRTTSVARDSAQST